MPAIVSDETLSPFVTLESEGGTSPLHIGQPDVGPDDYVLQL